MTVALSGDGGDELFAGYNRYFWSNRIWKKVSWLPLDVRKIIGRILLNLPIPLMNIFINILNKLSFNSININQFGDKVHKFAIRLNKVEKLDDGKERIVLSLKSHLSPIKAAVIPLKRNNDELVSEALSLKSTLQSLGKGRVLFDNAGNIGKSYRRHDEIGTPMCITIDFETLDDDSVTVRDRDTMEQKRIAVKEIPNYFEESLL